MRHTSRYLLWAAFSILTGMASMASAVTGKYQVDHVVSGITIKVHNDAGVKFFVRLAAIRVPETNETSGSASAKEQAKQHLTKLVGHRTIYVKSYGSDEPGRIVGEVYVRDRNVGLEMVAAGLAEVNRSEPIQGLYLEPYEQAEVSARAARRGIWGIGE